ncbi:MAG: matrixin family metalloprotease [Candidatus Omnitrophica bacterium]|nr:matrixin family metalloprotease [Candidatus Omnitrophota bacterium]MCA9436901.1 matrixin family metalloprotease [Candidatus Omnitrophota bacterium]MCA9443667.1 matrixin family metalloprotease [Candidatus Omnitrophota bacterium]
MKAAPMILGGRVATVLFAITICCQQSLAYTPILTIHDNLVRWDLEEKTRDQPNIIEGSVEFFINRAGTLDVEDDGDGTGGEFDILRHGFRAWEKLASSNIDFNDLKLTDQTLAIDADETNVILFDDNNYSGIFPVGTGVIAVTLLTFEEEEYSGVLDGNITDADLVFNDRDFDFGSNIEGKFIKKPGTDQSKGLGFQIPIDLLSVATHEIGHICGLDHSFQQNVVEEPISIRYPTLFPYLYSGDTQARSLEQDDIAGVTELYPHDEFNDKYNGSISGRVTMPNPDPDEAPIPLFGVDIIAYQNGAPVVSTITRTNGVYRMYGVPAGEYILRAQVISPANTGLIQEVALNFQSEYYPAAGLTSDASAITVIAGRRRSNLNFETASDVAPDFFEPNDNAGAATDLAVDGPRMIHQFYREGDEDWVRFEAQAGHAYRLTTDNLSVFADPLMDLFGADGETLIASDDDIDANFGNLAPRIEFTADTTGPHFVRLADVDDFFGFGTSFEFYIQDLGQTDMFDANLDGSIDAMDLLEYAANWGGPTKEDRSPRVQVNSKFLLEMIRNLKGN